jgi:hypothetical protein
MKKIGVFILLFILVFSMTSVLAQEEEPLETPGGVGEEEYDAIQGGIEEYTPIDEEGQFDPGKFTPIKSKAEERIEAINQWLVDNASWLSIVFGMVPEISWLFAMNLYILLFFIVSMVLNGDTLWTFLSGGKAKLFGLAVFIVLLITKFFTNVLVRPSYLFWKGILDWVNSAWGQAIMIIILVLMVVVFIVILIYFPQVLIMIRKWIQARKETKAKEKTDFERKVLHETVEPLQQKS